MGINHQETQHASWSVIPTGGRFLILPSRSGDPRHGTFKRPASTLRARSASEPTGVGDVPAAALRAGLPGPFTVDSEPMIAIETEVGDVDPLDWLVGDAGVMNIDLAP